MRTTKRFQTSALIDAANCPSETFRAWRNRNGLFPETQDSGKWNRFSFVDIMVTALVVDLTKRGVTAQVAVDAAMHCGTLLEKLSAVSADGDVIDVVGDLLAHWEKHTLPVVVIDSSLNRSPNVRLVDLTDVVAEAIGDGRSSVILVRLDKVLPFCLARLAVYDSEFDYSSGRRRASKSALAPEFAAMLPPSQRKQPKQAARKK